jgi:hypothetical protein
MRIDQLSKIQRERIVKAIEEDGFERVEDHEFYISFTKEVRDYELYSLNVISDFGRDNLFIMLKDGVIFEMAKDSFSKARTQDHRDFLDFKKQEKTRHSTSLDQAALESLDIEKEIDDGMLPGWARAIGGAFHELIEGSVNLYSVPLDSSQLLELDIKGKDHFAINVGKENSFMVYEGKADNILALLKDHPEKFFDAPRLKKVLSEIKQEVSES